MIGLVLALLSGFSFAASAIFIRRGVYRSGESFSPVPISVFLGVVFFGLLLLIPGQAEQFTSLSWLGAGSLAGAGVIHFVLGRMAAYTSIRLIGATRAAPIVTCSILFAALLGIFFLGEPVTISLVLALLLIVGGIILIGTTGNSGTGKMDVSKGSLAKGLFFALGAALCWGSSPALIKIGLREVNSPLLATFISYTTASMVVGSLLFNPRNNEKLRRLDRTSLIHLIIGGITVSIAQALRYAALVYSPVSVVAPIHTGTSGIFIFPLSFLLNREIETFNPRIIMAAIAVMAGVFLLFWAA